MIYIAFGIIAALGIFWLAASNIHLSQRLANGEALLVRLRTQFEIYASNHTAKGTIDGDFKAATNLTLAKDITAFLGDTEHDAELLLHEGWAMAETAAGAVEKKL